ncbi:hypothetical protein [Spirosoma radiotolerans]|uniref:Uncharacterized protein n=1 Tax=Spirosoma radiotolerans TaxID=1379870 RepID=A0A0E3V853_9BACT|nr:hypothetical protein [Spirosoma radiotolerans]AKD56472.1 hypothetical protein SD10_17730 [Spirosoma radiotolerans]
MKQVQWFIGMMYTIMAMAIMVHTGKITDASGSSASLILLLICGIMVLPPVTDRFPFLKWLIWFAFIGGFFFMLGAYPNGKEEPNLNATTRHF